MENLIFGIGLLVIGVILLGMTIYAGDIGGVERERNNHIKRGDD